MQVDGKEIVINGKFSRIAKLNAEYYEPVNDPQSFVSDLMAAGPLADIFTFVQEIGPRAPRYDFHLEWDSIAVLPITTYDDWWHRQINDKTRNMVRRAQKCGVHVRLVEFSQDLVRGIKEIYDESPLRQGKPFKHYGKDLETLWKAHVSFLDRSQFIGAYYEGELIGFIKLVHDDGVSHLMHIISKTEHRQKAPTNTLIAKAVELCALRGNSYLHYADWSRRGLGDFKRHHAFEQLDVPRYFVPLNWRGKIILFLHLHHKFSDLLPQNCIDFLVAFRSRWNAGKLPSLLQVSRPEITPKNQ